MKIRTLIGTVMLAVLLAGAALAADPSGTWKASVPGRDGNTIEMTMTFKASGDKLTGTISNPMGEIEIQEGKVSGDTITFKIKREFNGNTFIMNYEGQVGGNEIKFKSKREGSDNVREFTAKKA